MLLDGDNKAGTTFGGGTAPLELGRAKNVQNLVAYVVRQLSTLTANISGLDRDRQAVNGVIDRD